MEHTDVVILGAGAAGLMCALTAGARGRRVVVLDHASRAGEKILISGGGRCNFTNLHCGHENFHSDNPHFCRSALARYTPGDFLQMVERHRIAWQEKTLGQLFCVGSSRAIVDMLLAECAVSGAEIRLRQRVTDVSKSDRFRIETEAGAIEADALVLATGGLSIPKLGATGFAYEVGRRFGLGIVSTRPALVPLTLAQDALPDLQALAGVSTTITARSGRTMFREGMVFTHRGLSGPAVLQISSVWCAGAAVDLDLAPGTAPGFLVARKRARPRAGLRGALAEILPQRLADAFLPQTHMATPMGDVPDRVLGALEEAIRCWRVHPTGTEGFAKAEVTAGGIDTRSLSQRDMGARDVPGLFVIGEALDVTGWLGGFNFQWAWASGVSAGLAA